MLNYLPLRNVLIQGIKATVKNKALPDPARLCCTPCLVTLSLSLSLSLADALHPEGIPWILPMLDPGMWRRCCDRQHLWFVKFCAGDFSLDNAPCLGRPVKLMQSEASDENNQFYTIREIAGIFKISKSNAENHLYLLGYVNCFDVWVPYKLSKNKTLLTIFLHAIHCLNIMKTLCF